MDPTTGEEFFYKLNNLLLSSCHLLQNVFMARWKIETETDWESTEENGKQVWEGLGPQVSNSLQFSPKNVIQKGCLEEWDLPTLSLLLQYYGKHRDIYEDDDEIVKSLTRIANTLNNNPKRSISREEYKKNLKTFRKCLKSFKMEDDHINKIIQSVGVTSSSSAWEIVKTLFEKAKCHMYSRKFDDAIECHTKAISIPGLIPFHQSLAFEKRSECYLALAQHLKARRDPDCEILFDNAIADANKSLQFNSASWKAHRILGECFRMREKYSLAKSLLHYEKALIISPGQNQLKQELDSCKIQAGTLVVKELSKNVAHKIIKMTEDQFFKMKGELEGFKIKGQDHVFLGHQYTAGWSLPQNDAEAFRQYKKAAQLRNPEGIYHLALCYQDGRGVEKELCSAHQLYLEAAQMPPTTRGFLTKRKKNVGVAAAQHALGLMYDNGIHVERDYSKAAEWYGKGAENGVAGSANNLGNLFNKGKKGVEWNEKKAVKYWKQALDLGDPDAASSLMYYYIKHMEVEEARGMLEKGRQLGNSSLKALTDVDFMLLPNLCSPYDRNKLEKDVLAFEKHNGLEMEARNLTFLERFQKYENFKEGVEILTKVGEGEWCLNAGSTLKSKIPRKKAKVANDTGSGSTSNGRKADVDVEVNNVKGNNTNSEVQLRINEGIRDLHYLTQLFQKKNSFNKTEHKEIINIMYKSGTDVYDTLNLPQDVYKRVKTVITQLYKNKCEKKSVAGEEDMKIRFTFISMSLRNTESSLGLQNSMKLGRKGVEMYPENPYYYSLVSFAYHQLKDFEGGLRYTEEALKKFPNQAELRYLKATHLDKVLGQTWEELERRVEAYHEYIQALPSDHWKVPQIYYKMTSCYKSVASAENKEEATLRARGMMSHYFVRGCEAEKRVPTYFQARVKCEDKQMLLKFLSKGISDAILRIRYPSSNLNGTEGGVAFSENGGKADCVAEGWGVIESEIVCGNGNSGSDETVAVYEWPYGPQWKEDTGPELDEVDGHESQEGFMVMPQNHNSLQEETETEESLKFSANNEVVTPSEASSVADLNPSPKPHACLANNELTSSSQEASDNRESVVSSQIVPTGSQTPIFCEVPKTTGTQEINESATPTPDFLPNNELKSSNENPTEDNDPESPPPTEALIEPILSATINATALLTEAEIPTLSPQEKASGNEDSVVNSQNVLKIRKTSTFTEVQSIIRPATPESSANNEPLSSHKAPKEDNDNDSKSPLSSQATIIIEPTFSAIMNEPSSPTGTEIPNYHSQNVPTLNEIQTLSSSSAPVNETLVINKSGETPEIEANNEPNLSQDAPLTTQLVSPPSPHAEAVPEPLSSSHESPAINETASELEAEVLNESINVPKINETLAITESEVDNKFPLSNNPPSTNEPEPASLNSEDDPVTTDAVKSSETSSPSSAVIESVSSSSSSLDIQSVKSQGEIEASNGVSMIASHNVETANKTSTPLPPAAPSFNEKVSKNQSIETLESAANSQFKSPQDASASSMNQSSAPPPPPASNTSDNVKTATVAPSQAPVVTKIPSPPRPKTLLINGAASTNARRILNRVTTEPQQTLPIILQAAAEPEAPPPILNESLSTSPQAPLAQPENGKASNFRVQLPLYCMAIYCFAQGQFLLAICMILYVLFLLQRTN